MIYCFDIDGVICTNTDGDYANASPYNERIQVINELFDRGDTIKLFTARGSTTGIDWRAFTEQQMHQWDVKYHKLILGKPAYDIIIDDKATNDVHFFEGR